METWTYQLNFNSPVSVFSGNGVAGLVDRQIMRNARGLPVIPGSTIKGRWRYSALRLLSSAPKTLGLSFHSEGSPQCKTHESACTICRLFGSPAIRAAVWVGQAELDPKLLNKVLELVSGNKNPVINEDVEIRPGIAISRRRRTPVPNHLFYDEAAPAGYVFTGIIRVLFPITDVERKFLIGAARLMDRIGARKAVGRGVLEGGMIIQTGGTES